MADQPTKAGSDSLSFVRRTLIVIGLASLAAIVLSLLWFLRDILILVFGGALLAVFLTHVSRWLADRFHFRKGIALLLVILLLLTVVGIGTWLLAPHAIEQMGKLSTELGNALDQLRNRLQQTSWGQQLLNRMPPGQEIMSGVRKLLAKMPTIISTLFAAIGGIFLLLFVGLYGSIQSRLFYEATIKLVPPRHRPRGREILDTMGETIYWWLLGRFVSMLLIGSFTTLGLYLLNIPLAFSLGLLAGLLTFIPNIGPLISVIPAVLIAFTVGPTKVLWVLGLYTVLQTLESYFITPMVQKQAIEMPPALILIAQVCGGLIFGALGILLATPLLALIIILVKMIYIEDLLDDTTALGQRD